MTSVQVGSRILVRGERQAVVLRTLRAADLEGGWAVPVMADLAALQSAGLGPGPAEVEIRTPQGLCTLDAELVRGHDGFTLRAPGLRTAAVMEQRREAVRAMVALPLRGTVLARGATAPDGPSPVLTGRTRTVSAGGLAVALDVPAGSLPPGATLYLELALPGGDLAPVVVTVLGREQDDDGDMLRVRFADISPLDRERLVRLVFAQQRADLAERRRSLDRVRD
jgi:hypothetical protein